MECTKPLGDNQRIFIIPIKKIKLISQLDGTFGVVYKNNFTKEEVFQMIEALLQLKTID
jgi:hypothetical protein